MTRRKVETVEVVDVQKRKVPSKHYVFVISVTWSDGSVNVVYRRYSRFFELQTKLLEEYPDEGGVKDPTKRILPFLPGKIIFGRSHVRDVALKRMESLNEYCKALVSLPPIISQFELVIKFFEPTPEDINLPTLDKEKKKKKKDFADNISDPVVLEQYVAIADYKKQNRTEVNMVAGDVVEVIDKSENGWWFVNVDEEQGWVPGAYLEPADGSDESGERLAEGQEENYITTSAYKAELDDEISFEMGVIVTVLQKNFDGWWLVRNHNKEGWAPAMYLKIPDPSQVKIVAAASSAATKTWEPQHHTAPAADITTTQGKSNSKSGRKIPPRRTTVKRSVKKLPVRINNMSYEKTLIGGEEEELFNNQVELKSPEAEYFTVGDFKAVGINCGLNFDEGISVQVLEKTPNGWWYGKIGEEEGWIPSSFLGKREKQRQTTHSPRSSPRVSRKPEALRQTENRVKSGKPDKPSVTKPAESTSTSKKPTRPPLPVKKVEPAQQAESKPASFRSNLAAALSAHAVPKGSAKPGIPSETAEEESYVTTADYNDESHGSISFRQGQVARIIEKSAEGWWYVSISGREGWAPASYLTKVDRKAKTPARPIPPKKPQENKPSVPTRPKVFPPPVSVKPDASKAPMPRPRSPGHSTSKPVVFPNKKAPHPAPSKLLKPKPKPRKPDVTQSQPGNVTQRALGSSVLSAGKCMCIAIASYDHEGTDCLSFQEGDEFEFLEDSNTGWWLVRSGDGLENWAPANYLEKKVVQGKSPPEKSSVPHRPSKPAVVKPVKPVFVAVATYQDDEEAVNFQEGDQMEVLEQDDGGWWLVKVNGKTGWAPSNFLKPI